MTADVDGTLLFDVPRELYPFTHRFIEIGGNRIHYVDEGRGETILMLHGNPTWSFLYRKMIPALKDRFRCVAPDYPGFGLSAAHPGFGYHPAEHSRVVEGFAGQLGLDDITLVVQDWGGPIGLGFAGRNPERIKRLVVGNTWAWPVTSETHLKVFSALMGGPLGRAMALTFNGVVRGFLKEGFARPLPPAVKRMYLAPFGPKNRRLPTSIFPRQIVAAADYLREVESGLPRLADKPVLFTWGMRDVAFRADYLRRFEGIFPNHKTIELPEARHFWQEDAGEEAAQAIRAWMSG